MNHTFFFYKKQLQGLMNEVDKDMRYFNSKFITSICLEKRNEGLLSNDEYMEILVSSREVINA